MLTKVFGSSVFKGGSVIGKQRLILIGFISAQLLDVITTHIGLQKGRQELNGVANFLITSQGEFKVYALKLTLVAILLGLLVLLGRRKPRIWDAYLIAAWITTAAVVNNVIRIVT